MVDISDRELRLPDAVIGKLIKIAAEDKDILSLGPGEPDFPAPRPIVKLVKKYADKCSHYSPPGGRHELKEAIVNKVRKENHILADMENVIVTCGSQESMLMASACTLDVSEKIIIPDPSFLGYLPTFKLFYANVQKVPLMQENDFEIDPDEVKKAIDTKKTKVILINSPANPTGGIIRKKVLEELADIAVQYDLYIFSDEAYEEIIYDDKHISIGSFNGMEDYVVSFFTFSKSYAMCGFRLGYTIAPKKLIEAMTKTHIYTTICAPTISQMVGAEAIKLDKKYINEMVREYKRRRDMLVKRLNNLNLVTKMPKGAFYTFSDISSHSKDSYKFSRELLEKAKVAVVPGKEFGDKGEGFIRCSYATDYKIIEKALDRIEKFIG